VDKGSTVTLVVSSGLQEVRVPDVGGETRQNAIQILKRADLAVGKITTQSSDSVPAGAVISQSPAPGTRINSGTPVDLLISSGRATVSVPYVIGETQQTAIAELHGAGLRATITTAPSNQPQGTVIAQNPASNAQAHQGDVVQITVSKGQPQQAMPNVVGQNADSAQRALENNYGLHVTQQTNTSPCTQLPGFVCRQSPAPGTGVSRGDRAILYVQPTPTPS
jgi:serine/threonine-protein kinase